MTPVISLAPEVKCRYARVGAYQVFWGLPEGIEKVLDTAGFGTTWCGDGGRREQSVERDFSADPLAFLGPG